MNSIISIPECLLGAVMMLIIYMGLLVQMAIMPLKTAVSLLNPLTLWRRTEGLTAKEKLVFSIPVKILFLGTLSALTYFAAKALIDGSFEVLAILKLLVTIAIVFFAWWLQHVFTPVNLAVAGAVSLYNYVVNKVIGFEFLTSFVTEYILAFTPLTVQILYSSSSMLFGLLLLINLFSSDSMDTSITESV